MFEASWEFYQNVSDVGWFYQNLPFVCFISQPSVRCRRAVVGDGAVGWRHWHQVKGVCSLGLYWSVQCRSRWTMNNASWHGVTMTSLWLLVTRTTCIYIIPHVGSYMYILVVLTHMECRHLAVYGHLCNTTALQLRSTRTHKLYSVCNCKV